MRTWKHKKKICRSRKSGRFAKKAKCKAFVTQLVRAWRLPTLFD